MIDYLAQKQASNQRVQDLLNPQSIEDQINKTRQNIQGSRNYDALQGIAGSVGQGYGLGNIPLDMTRTNRNLDSSLNTNLANQRYNLYNQNFSNRVNQGMNQVGDAQNVLGLNKNYAANTANQNISLQQQGRMNDMQRLQAQKQADMQTSFANQGQYIQNQYLYPQTDYQSSIMRLLTGIPAQIGTSMLMNKMYPMQNNQNYVNPNTGMGYNQNQQVYGPQQQTYGPPNPFKY